MVFFTCNACGESLKKNAVDKHWQQKCRACSVLSCLDCGKDFPGDSYKEHVKCISEEEKYSGKNYKPKPNANKGEQKQSLWVQQVQAAIDKVSADPQLKNLLQQIQEYPNIPRKKAKFENFLRNSFNVHRQNLATQAWDLLNVEIQQKPSEEIAAKAEKQKESTSQSEESQDDIKETNKLKAIENQEENTSDVQVKKTKKERKEERKKKQTKSEKKDSVKETKVDKKSRKDDSAHNGEAETIQKSKKKSKRKIEEDILEEEPEKKRSKGKEFSEGRLNDTIEEPVASPRSFKWKSAITSALESAPDNTLSIKKLRKKVFAEYCNKESSEKSVSQDQLNAKFMKKIKSNSKLKVHKEKVKLISSS